MYLFKYNFSDIDYLQWLARPLCNIPLNDYLKYNIKS